MSIASYIKSVLETMTALFAEYYKYKCEYITLYIPKQKVLATIWLIKMTNVLTKIKVILMK